MKIVLVRHASTIWNENGYIQGSKDIPLSFEGRKQARVLAQSLENKGISEIITSDLRRAKETAKIIQSLLNIPVIINKNLRECSFGKAEGMSRNEVEQKYGVRVASFFKGSYFDYNFYSVGGECRLDVWQRYAKVINSLLNKNNGELSLIVGHSRGLRTLLHGLGYKRTKIKRGGYRIISIKKAL